MTAYRMYIEMEDFMNATTVTVSNRGGSCRQNTGLALCLRKDMNENLLARSPRSLRTDDELEHTYISLCEASEPVSPSILDLADEVLKDAAKNLEYHRSQEDITLDAPATGLVFRDALIRRTERLRVVYGFQACKHPLHLYCQRRIGSKGFRA